MIDNYYGCMVCDRVYNEEKSRKTLIHINSEPFYVCPNCLESLRDDGMEMPKTRPVGFSTRQRLDEKYVDMSSNKELELEDF